MSSSPNTEYESGTEANGVSGVVALETEDKRESGVGDLNEDGVAGGIEHGFMSFTTDPRVRAFLRDDARLEARRQDA